jgi:uncharacterized membrane protein YvlD (DUF360 family)
MTAARTVARLIFRFLLVWGLDTLSLVIMARLLPGVNLEPPEGQSKLAAAAAAALVLSLVNLVIRPLVLLLGLPFGFFVVFGLGFLANAVALMITSGLLSPGFSVDGWAAALVGGIVFAAINAILTGFTSVSETDSFYQGVIERLARRQTFHSAGDGTRGLVMLEIDGLSYWHIQKAIEDGYMPTVKTMLAEEGYRLSRFDCGIPSQTSACQAGIMYGDNFDIPSFRWYDKDLGRVMVSTKEAALLNERYSRGHGLMRGGSSINNMLSGDAEKSVLTIANALAGTPEEKKRRAEDIYLLMLNPYFLMRTIALFFWDVILEVYQGWQQVRKKVWPRLDRLHHFYPFVRAGTTVFMRDVPANLIVLDIIRGSPSIYSTYVGYDEVAHHSGPWTTDAFGTLRQFDQVIARIRDIVARKAPRPYELILLSDHGQSFGPTFRQRYGVDLKSFIEAHLPQGARVLLTAGGDEGSMSVATMGDELSNISEQEVGGGLGRAVVGQAQHTVSRGMEEAEPAEAGLEEGAGAAITVCGSGNLAQVYFDLAPRKLALSELNAAYPGMVDALVGHEGIGFVVAYADDGTPLAFGKDGVRNLHTGEVSGSDPLAPYSSELSPPELRAAQVRRVADFPHAGDLIINSTLYPDGTVAAMEELIGNHGGMGGEQTDAFLLHPEDMEVPPTRSSTDVFALLNARRGLPPAPPRPTPEAVKGREAWSPALLLAGFGHTSVWLGRAVRTIFLDQRALREVADDVTMTGPALLIGIGGVLLAAILRAGGAAPENLLSRTALWLLAVAIVFLAARLLGGRGDFTRTLRVMGFAHSAYVLGLLALVPPLAPLARLVAFVLSFLAIWIGVAEAQQLRGWRGLVLPVIAVLVAVVGGYMLSQLLAGAQMTLQSLGQDVGVLPW